MQKEKLSALMDGETLDSELLKALTHDPEMQKTWESYHLIRDSMRGIRLTFSISIYPLA
ncbi:anti-RNA polymerase sigma factor SigE [Salmonella enterica subsp. enterica serovar Heidelberg str. 90-0318]|nr:anti-RNA polymerase sigma factor SigE [Salmonella enterica subsp. enterica serovar Heidelberg str. 90-0318]